MAVVEKVGALERADLRTSAPEQKRDEDLRSASTTGRLCLLGSHRVRDRDELKRCYRTMRLLVLFSQSQPCGERFGLSTHHEAL
jgi:hypothetical protein